MTKKILGSIGVAALGLGSAFLASPALATTVTDCEAIAGSNYPGDLTYNSAHNYCQMTLSQAGSGTWTLANGTADMQAVVIGAGGGAYADGSNGYAGDGGEVFYMDLSGVTSSISLDITIGAGGQTGSSPTSGGDTIVTPSATLNALTAQGGNNGNGGSSYCSVDGSYSTYVGLGDGARSNATTTNGEACGNPGSGVIPNDTLDGASVAGLSLFQTSDMYAGSEYGRGGNVYWIHNSGSPSGTPDTTIPGQGGSVLMNTEDLVVSDTDNGHNGAIIFRWTPAAPTEANGSLAGTGSNDIALMAVAGGAIAVGYALTRTAARRRK